MKRETKIALGIIGGIAAALGMYYVAKAAPKKPEVQFVGISWD